MFAEGPSGAAVQAALVMESDAPDAFCSIATEVDRAPHKMLQKYSQQQAVLPVLFIAGTTYTMTTRCINQRQEPVRDTAVRLLLYSEKPMHASPVQGSSLHAMPKTALDGFVSRATAEPFVYGHAGIPDDCKRQVSAADKKADVQQDPTVLHAVIEELVEQRDSIASFARAELAGEIDPQLEALRLTNRELRAKVDDLALELKQAKTIAAQGERRAASSADHLLAVAAAAAPPPPPTPPPPDVIAELQRKLEDEKRQNEQLRASLTKSNEQLRAAVTQMAEVKEAAVTHSHAQTGSAPHPGTLAALLPLEQAVPALLEQAMSNELQLTQAELAASKAQVEHLELELESQRLAAAKAKQATEGALLEAAGAQEQTVRVVDELAAARTDAREAREALDAVKLGAFRKVDQLNAEITEITAGKEAAEAEVLLVREAEALAKARVTSLEDEIQKMRLVSAQLELTHQTQLLNQHEAQRLEREALEAHQATELQHHVEEAALLREVLDSASTLMASFEHMRAEVANLTADNECYVAERRQFEDALSCRFELRSTCNNVEVVGFMLEDPLAVDLVSQLALQCEQQRALDATERDLAEALGCIDTLVAFCRDELQPEADAAWSAVHELPRLREDLLQAGMLRSDGMAQLQRARDEAEAERQRLLDEVAAVNAKLAYASEQAAFTTELQASQLTQLTMEFTECNEELQNWRTGNIRLANARQWREEREKAKAGGVSSGGPPIEGGGVEASPPPAATPA